MDRRGTRCITGKPHQYLLCAVAVCLLAFSLPASGASDANPNWVEVRSAHFVVAGNAGEAEARRIAEQLEEIRGAFHNAFGKLRVDPPQPVVILAARDEATMKMLAPDEWEGEGHVHPTGLFHSDGEKDYVVLRLDAPGTSAFHTVYHEYTHSLLNLNFGRVPLWLNEGLAEFFGNSTLGDKDAKTAAGAKAHLYVLNKNEFLPIETLLEVKENSPYYNEMNRATIFYAESWAIVQYLLLDPEARREQFLSKFLIAWSRSGNQAEAARAAFGDLEGFRQKIQRYIHQPNLRAGMALPAQEGPPGDYAVRNLSAGEVLALRGDFFVHRKELEQARPLLEQAVQSEPNLAAAHEALGFYYFRDGNFVSADDEMTKAMELGSKSFVPYYCHGLLLSRDLTATQGMADRAATYLEQAARMNPQFAPIFEALTQAYSRSGDTQKQALEAATRATQLEPRSSSYLINLIYTLLNNNGTGEARVLGKKLLAMAGSPEETRTAQTVWDRIKEEEDWAKENEGDSAIGESARGEVPAAAPVTPAAAVSALAPVASAPAAAAATAARPGESGRRLGSPTWIGVDGPIGTVDCSHSPEITLTLDLGNGSMSFHAADLRRVGLSGSNERSTPGPESCQQWAGRHVKVWFRLMQGGDYMGEIIKIHFY